MVASASSILRTKSDRDIGSQCSRTGFTGFVMHLPTLELQEQKTRRSSFGASNKWASEEGGTERLKYCCFQRRCFSVTLREVLVRLVAAAVFKTVGPYVKHAVGGFDSHALPPFSQHRWGWDCQIDQLTSSLGSRDSRCNPLQTGGLTFFKVSRGWVARWLHCLTSVLVLVGLGAIATSFVVDSRNRRCTQASKVRGLEHRR